MWMGASLPWVLKDLHGSMFMPMWLLALKVLFLVPFSSPYPHSLLVYDTMHRLKQVFSLGTVKCLGTCLFIKNFFE